VEEELGYMERKKVLEELVGACAVMKQIKSKLTAKDPLVSYHSGGRIWPHRAEEGS
jgi:hypothetical protein